MRQPPRRVQRGDSGGKGQESPVQHRAERLRVHVERVQPEQPHQHGGQQSVAEPAKFHHPQPGGQQHRQHRLHRPGDGNPGAVHLYGNYGGDKYRGPQRHVGNNLLFAGFKVVAAQVQDVCAEGGKHDRPDVADGVLVVEGGQVLGKGARRVRCQQPPAGHGEHSVPGPAKLPHSEREGQPHQNQGLDSPRHAYPRPAQLYWDGQHGEHHGQPRREQRQVELFRPAHPAGGGQQDVERGNQRSETAHPVPVGVVHQPVADAVISGGVQRDQRQVGDARRLLPHDVEGDSGPGEE